MNKITMQPLAKIDQDWVMKNTVNTLYIDYSLADKKYSDDVEKFEYGNKKTKAYKIHWYKHLSTYTDTYKKKVKPILKQNIKDIIVGPTYDFIKPHVIEYTDTVDFFKKTFLKLKKLKTITFEFNENGCYVPIKSRFNDLLSMTHIDVKSRF